ncbi:flagellar biosynthesis protein FlgD [Hahella sp. CCB-MM4]|uniref:flagellar hook assembly protein FlgD n=1 Tax=Hahella sp. (strain CCB-MM4) TaxID=1926491 RepID=UPI000B9C2950|nr:flagellar hook assembly protein FlgD [Hahella sp. CCB-MM4]OZG73859.1 flagellar biosynthesis protein FlgD [Hahella sp. CCB-MM4]
MSNVSSVNSSDVLSNYTLKSEEKEKSNELGQNEFLELMIAQMNNQSPLDPQDNAEFVAQLAQFSSVEGIEKLNGTVDTMASQYRSTQALQASAMVGRDVLVSADYAVKTAAGGVNGVAELPGSTSGLTVSVYNLSGELVKKMDMGQQVAGDVPFSWDGTNSKGETLPAGKYEIVAEARYGGETEEVASYLAANVDSVSIGTTGSVVLNLADMGSVGINDVKQIF